MSHFRIPVLLLFLLSIVACSSDPPPPPEAVSKAFQMAAAGEHQKAVKFLENEAKNHPADAAYPFYLGRLQAQYFNEIHRGNVRFLELKTLPHKPFGQYLQLKKPDGTINGYQYKDITPILKPYLKAISLNPRFTDAYLEAAMAYASLFQIKKAISLLEKGMRLMPDNYRFPFLLAYFHRHLGDLDTALKMYRSATKMEPDASEAHLYAGTLLLKMNKPAEARKHLSRVVRINANTKDVDNALQALFLHYYRFGIKGDSAALASAISWGDEHADAFKKRPRMLIRLGKACYLAGQKKKATQYLQEGLNEIPTDPQALTFLGELLADAGKINEAIETYTRSLSLQDRSLTRYMLGTLLLRSGKPAQGVIHLRKAAATRKNDPEILFTLASALEKSGATRGEQLQAWKRYLTTARSKGHNQAGITEAKQKIKLLGG